MRYNVIKNDVKMTEELKGLVNDFGGGRKKQSEKSQLYYDLTKNVLDKFHNKSYFEIEQFAEYLKEVTKRISTFSLTGRENN